jgi:hypothetical protein
MTQWVLAYESPEAAGSTIDNVRQALKRDASCVIEYGDGDTISWTHRLLDVDANGDDAVGYLLTADQDAPRVAVILLRVEAHLTAFALVDTPGLRWYGDVTSDQLILTPDEERLLDRAGALLRSLNER